MAKQSTSTSRRNRVLRRSAGRALLALGWLAFAPPPEAARAQGAPSNAAETGGSFAGAQSPRAGEEPAPRAWQATLRGFLEYDSNVGLTEEQAPEPYDYQPAFRAGVSGAGNYRVFGGDRFETGVGGYFAQSLTAGESYADEYSLTSLAPQVYASAAFDVGDKPTRTQLAYQYRRDWLTGDGFEKSHNLRLATSVRLAESLELEASYGIALETFDASGFHALDDRRDADHHRFGLRGTWFRREAGQSLTLGYERLDNKAENRDFDFEGNAVSARFRTLVPAPWLLGLELFAAYTDADYVHYSTTPQREARTQFYRARLLVPLSRHWTVDAAYSHLRIGADQARFRSQRNAVSAGVSYHF